MSQKVRRWIPKAALALLAPLALCSTVSAQLVYSQPFTTGVVYGVGTPQFDGWVAFRAALATSGVQSIRLSGSLDPIGRICNTPAVAQMIADALRTATGLTVFCSPHTWSVSAACNIGPAVGAGSPACSSCGDDYVLRPQAGNVNWGGVGVGGGSCNSSQTLTATVGQSAVITADLSITKDDGVTSAVPGGMVTYTIVVTNNGPDAVTGATVADTFPGILSGVTYTSTTTGTVSGNTAAGSGDVNDTVDMSNGATITYMVMGTIDPSATGSLANTATVTEPVGVTDPVPGNNSATDTDTLTPEADLSISKTDSPDPVAALDTLTYTVTVSNAGLSDATGVTVTDTLPAGLSSAVTTGCAEDPAGVPTCTLGPIAAGAMAGYTIDVTVGAGAAGALTNTATVSSAVTDPAPGNDAAMATTTIDCPDPATPGIYGGFTAADCASSVVKAKNQAQLDAYLADFGVGGGTKPKHLNVQFNPATTNVTVISPCRIKMLGASKLIAIAADNVCLYGRAGVTVGAGTPAAGSLIDADDGDILMVSEENKVQTKPGIGYIAGDMELEASTTAEIGSGSTVVVGGPLTLTSDGTASTSHALIQPGSDVTVDDLTMTAPQQVRIRDNADVDVTNDLTMTSSGGTSSSVAEIQQGSIVVIGIDLAMSGFSVQIGAGAGVDVTGTATLAASGSATASDAEILSNASLTAADVSQTATHKAVLSGGATVDAGAGNALIDAPVCAISGTVTSGSTSGSCLP